MHREIVCVSEIEREKINRGVRLYIHRNTGAYLASCGQDGETEVSSDETKRKIERDR